jgi:hypothetical protein
MPPVPAEKAFVVPSDASLAATRAYVAGAVSSRIIMGPPRRRILGCRAAFSAVFSTVAMTAVGCSGSAPGSEKPAPPPSVAPSPPPTPAIERTNPAVDGQAYIGGHVERPGAYPLSAGRPLTLRAVLSAAGADYQRPGGFEVELVRRGADGRETYYELGEASYRSATGDTPLQPDDQVYLVGVKLTGTGTGTGVGVDSVRTPDCFPPPTDVVRLP